MPINTSSSDEGVTGAAKFVTSTLGVRTVFPLINPLSYTPLPPQIPHSVGLPPLTFSLSVQQ